ncbi:MAG: YheC/YheD family protein [Selenomonadaceae bacterium]|nr:YheC/YheD family protein [Selenomonadaceae bacterium]
MKEEPLTNILADDVHELTYNSFLHSNSFTDALANDMYEIETISKGTNKPLRVGVLRGNKNKLPLTSSLNLMAYMARQFNIELYFFTSKDFNPEDKTVRATLIDGNSQIEKNIPLPKIIYNPFDCFAGENRKEIKSMIMKESYFVRRGLSMTKQRIYDLLLDDGRFKDFLIETHLVENFEHFMSLFGKYHNDVVLKPIHGMQGTGVNKITFNEEGYVISNDKTGKKIFKTVDEFKTYYDKTFAQSKHVLQPYIVSRTKYDNSFDIRIHARRAAEGKFKVFSYPRICRFPGRILSTISAGGYTMPLDNFLKAEFGNDWKTLFDRLTDLGNNFPEHFQSLLPRKISSMGLDVGIERRGESYELKLFEVNIGGPAINIIPTEVAFANLEYIQYLGKCLEEGKDLNTV